MPLVVVGGGPAGVAAATAAARAGVRVLLLDEHPLDPELMAMDVPLYFGQRMSAAVRDRGVMLERVVRANPALEEAIEAGVEVELGVSVWGAFRPGPAMREIGGACVGVADQSRSWLVGYDRLIVAAGARDLGPRLPGLGEGRHDGRGRRPSRSSRGTRRWPRGAWSSSARGRSAWPWRPSRARAASRCPASWR